MMTAGNKPQFRVRLCDVTAWSMDRVSAPILLSLFLPLLLIPSPRPTPSPIVSTPPSTPSPSQSARAFPPSFPPFAIRSPSLRPPIPPPQPKPHLDDTPVFYPSMVTAPDKTRPIFVHALRDCAPVRLPDGTALEMKKGHVSLTPYHVIEQLLERGEVELV
ncbi:hypothetical protein NMY22_g3344 [Coprinellus aureogranulatus]|nr:hypothetical protein NMY22_g3344 [Coprinellus aureogranulatus]